MHQEKERVNGQEVWRSWTDNSFETLQLTDIERLAATKGLSGYTIRAAPTAVKPMNFARIEDAAADQNADAGGVTLIGERDMALNARVTSGTVGLKEGRWLTPKDAGACVIHEDLAEKNGLALGDTLQVAGMDSEHTETATIVGIYQEKQRMTPYMSGDTYRAENVIFCNLTLPESLTGEGPLYEQAVFAVADVDKYDAVRASLTQADIDWQRYDLIDNDGNLEIMGENIEGLAQSSTILLIVVTVGGLLMLVLILAFWNQSRRHEFGVLRALGVRRRRIWLQVMVECLGVGSSGVLLAMLLAPALSAKGAAILVGAQLKATSLNQAAEQAAIASDYIAPELTLNAAATVLSAPVMALVAAAVTGLIVLAVTLTLGWMLGRSPRSLIND